MVSEKCLEVDWATKLLYVGIFLTSLMLSVLVLYMICRHFKCGPDDDDDDSLSGSRRRRFLPSLRSRGCSKQDELSRLDESGNPNRQTMFSVLGKSLHDNDTIFAAASSSIPLKKLGTQQNSDIIIDVSQQLLMDKDKLTNLSQDHQCIVCIARKSVTWSQVICYAQTTIAVLVYKRNSTDNTAIVEQDNQASTLVLPSPSPSMVVEPGSRRQVVSASKTIRRPKSSPDYKRQSPRDFKEPKEQKEAKNEHN